MSGRMAATPRRAGRVPAPAARPAPGLRERKKASLRAAIQRQALRLFREQGYEATTVSQIAAAAEVSESSFFRYFPTKEDLVRWDAFDPLIISALRVQPARLGPLPALRAAFRQVLGELSAAQRAEVRERLALAMTILPARATLLDTLGEPLRQLTAALAARAGRKPADPAVRTLVGAVLGVCLAAMFAAAEDPRADVVALVDEAMGRLEAGLKL